MESMKLVGLNTKWYRYQNGYTQEKFCEITGFKMAYISIIESGNANLTCRNIDVIADALKVSSQMLFDKETAKKAKDLPKRIYMYKK